MFIINWLARSDPISSLPQIDYAARRIAQGKFLNAGQSCAAPDYLLVDRKIKKELIDALIGYTKHFFGENPEESPDFPRSVNDIHFDWLYSLMQKGTIITGGETKKETRYISPTIIDNITQDDPIMQEEIFGFSYRLGKQVLFFLGQEVFHHPDFCLY